MLLSGTVVADPETVIEEGAVVTEGDSIAFVGDAEEALERYPDHERRDFDVVAPGFVNAHVHTVQSLGRGIADDADLMTWLFDNVLPMEAALDREATQVAALLGYLELVESGATTVLDHPTVDHTEAVFEAAERVGLRARLGKVLMDRDAPEGLEEETEDALAESEALIERFHGANDGRIQYAVTPRFAITCSEDCLRGARELADAHDGVRLHTHTSETRDGIAQIQERTGQRNVAYLDDVGLTGPDVTLAHCVWTDEDERDLLADTDTRVVHCPSANMKLASGVAPVTDYRDRGVTVALGNDGPPCNNTLDPLTEMREASLLAKVDALDAETLPAEAVLEMATLAGAEAAGFERVGALREGWRADVVGLRTDAARASPRYDPRSFLVYTARAADVALTMVDGDILYENGTHRTVDAASVRARAQRLVDGLDVA